MTNECITFSGALQSSLALSFGHLKLLNLYPMSWLPLVNSSWFIKLHTVVGYIFVAQRFYQNRSVCKVLIVLSEILSKNKK